MPLPPKIAAGNAAALFRRHRWLGWFCVLAVIAAIGITIWSCEDGKPHPAQSPKPIAFSVSFQGYSNSPSGQRWAILTVTNRDFGNLCLGNPLTVEWSDHPKDAQDTHGKLPDFIPPHSCGRMVVEVPLAPGSWRARCMISRSTWRDPIYNALSSRGWPAHLIPVRRTQTMDSLVTDWVRE